MMELRLYELVNYTLFHRGHLQPTHSSKSRDVLHL